MSYKIGHPNGDPPIGHRQVEGEDCHEDEEVGDDGERGEDCRADWNLLH